MASRSRRIIGRVGLVLFVIVYIAVAMVVGAVHFPERHPVVQILYFAVAGIAWVFPAMLIIAWSRGGQRGSGG
ncbi:DUF2842 domain-containing protein [Lutibaculum baratangense]|uniref:DUF2842 domain-containing protein n=1 Tax=Lutibaculum baratangense AMV1 TaxID=631454 RepID=V4RAT6_9HYPH|nr:DUF2842 domain-containing protein [Lutibaculum baratangense]ESR23291.1 hypothetical protein N177_3359 [Lutibaculum baratangense AMV1]